jgi:hypothetical protein
LIIAFMTCDIDHVCRGIAARQGQYCDDPETTSDLLIEGKAYAYTLYLRLNWSVLQLKIYFAHISKWWFGSSKTCEGRLLLSRVLSLR